MILKILKAIITPYFALYAISKKFILHYEGFSYKFESNGEEHLLDSLRDQEIETVFDVGANVGSWSEIALRKFKTAEIHAFEISKTTFKSLEERHKKNSRITLNNFGLSERKGEFEYKDYGENSGANSLITDADFHDDRIKPKMLIASVESGDDYCFEHGIKSIDFLKIDVEGAEHLVLTGFSKLMAEGRIKVIQFEYGYTHGDAKFLIKDFYKLLTKHGYVIGPLKPTGVIFMDFSYALNDFNSGPNYVAVHKSYSSIIEQVRGQPIKGFPHR